MRQLSNPRTRSRTVLALSCVWLVAQAVPSFAVSFLRTQELPELVRESTRAVRAQVTDVRYGFDERRLHSTWVTLHVEEALYGDDLPGPGGEITIKVYGAPEAMPDGSRVFLDGTPLYAVGQRYLLLLIKESGWGFTNTAGLFQGAFAIEAAGRVAGVSATHHVFGETGLAGLLNDLGDSGRRVAADRALAAAAKAGGPVSYSTLREAVTLLWTREGGKLHPNKPRTAAGDGSRPSAPVPAGSAEDGKPRGFAATGVSR